MYKSKTNTKPKYQGRNNSKTQRGKKNETFTRDKKEIPEFKTNDPSWYNSDIALLRDAATLPFAQAAGTAIPWNARSVSGDNYNIEFSNSAHHGIDTNTAIPGIITLNLLPSIGLTEDASDPINVAATSFYSFVRHANSGHSNYDSPNLMMYAIAMANVYSYINWLQRIYGTVMLYANKNRYYPKALVSANHVDYDDVLANLANFRYQINDLINKASSLSVPAEISYFKRVAFNFANVYRDGDDVMDQLYMYTPVGFYKYRFDSTTQKFKLFVANPRHTGTQADPASLPTSDDLWKVSELIDFGNSMLAPIIGSEDFNIMSGDILKAYGEGGCLKLVSLPADYVIGPVYDFNVLTQFHNATIIPIDEDTPMIEENVTNLLTGPHLVSRPRRNIFFNNEETGGYSTEFVVQAVSSEMNDVLNINEKSPSPESVMEATRLKAWATRFTAIDEGDGRTDESYYVECGTEIALSASIWYYVKNMSTNLMELSESRFTTFEETQTFDSIMSLNSPFMYAPLTMNVVNNYIQNNNSNRVDIRTICYNFGNYTMVSKDVLKNLHNTALLSLFYVPGVNKGRR